MFVVVVVLLVVLIVVCAVVVAVRGKRFPNPIYTNSRSTAPGGPYFINPNINTTIMGVIKGLLGGYYGIKNLDNNLNLRELGLRPLILEMRA